VWHQLLSTSGTRKVWSLCIGRKNNLEILYCWCFEAYATFCVMFWDPELLDEELNKGQGLNVK
jgi:hypothetical protein